MILTATFIKIRLEPVTNYFLKLNKNNQSTKKLCEYVINMVCFSTYEETGETQVDTK